LSTARQTLVLGVIGHVDHGKTALVRAVTGMETDRLQEEKRRGISIALGFAHLTVDGRSIDCIDMPGHERFVRTMVAGATGMDAALLVVAANEGIKPQTREHLDVARLLGVRQLIIAISKADLVSSAAAEATAQQVASLCADQGFVVADRVLTSAVTGAGLPALRHALAGLPAAQGAAASDGFPYLPIDRVFTIAGHGTVVTGTLRKHALAVSDEVCIAPGDRPVRLRGLQVHGERVSLAHPGQRVAANLRDVEAGDIARGAALTARGMLVASHWVTVQVRSVDNAPPLPNGAGLVLLFGTEEVAAKVRLLERDILHGGESSLAQLHCQTPISVPARERFILRRASPALTIAGGVVIDPSATRLRRHCRPTLDYLAALCSAAPARLLALALEQADARGVPLARLAQLSGVSPARAALMTQGLPAVLGRSRVAVFRASLDRVTEAIPKALAGHPDGLSQERLAALLPWAGAAVLDDALAGLAAHNGLHRVGGMLRLATPQRDKDRTAAEATAAAQLAEALRHAGLTPPDPCSLAPGPLGKRLLDRLVREGLAIRAVDVVQKRELVFHADAVENAKRHLAPLLARSPGLLVGEAGAALGISRKYCVPLLEHLDAIRFTRRVADRRVLAHSPA
jgi:selenocysteine-specific elongation factor